MLKSQNKSCIGNTERKKEKKKNEKKKKEEEKREREGVREREREREERTFLRVEYFNMKINVCMISHTMG